jgi:hypothetical protein
MKLTNTIQKKLKVSSTQLLYQSAPYQAAILFATGPFVDQLLTNRSVFAHNYSAPVLVCSQYFPKYMKMVLLSLVRELKWLEIIKNQDTQPANSKTFEILEVNHFWDLQDFQLWYVKLKACYSYNKILESLNKR